MAVQYKDYYQTLGVARSASQEEIQKAFRKQAAKLHPDVNKAPDAEAKFKELNEAYEVLRDPDKRKMYDQLGSNWKAGQSFTPPPGWQANDFGGAAEFAGFSEFFESLFGGGLGGGFGGFRDLGGRRGRQRAAAGADHEAELEVDVEDLVRPAKKSIQLQGPDGAQQIELTIPAGIRDGQRIRLAGQGGAGAGGGPAGDLLLRVRVRPHAVLAIDGDDLRTDVAITPWEAMFGAEVSLDTPSGRIALKVPPNSQGGQVLRLRGLGLATAGGGRGSLLASLRIVNPEAPSEREREHYERLRQESSYQPAPRLRKPSG
jgi:curved DNA-binding protein